MQQRFGLARAVVQHPPASAAIEGAFASGWPRRAATASSTLHCAGELVKQRAGLFVAHIPYRGTVALTNDLVGGALDFAMISPTAAAPFIAAGRIVPLGVTSPQRFPTLPQELAFAEHAQFKGFDLAGWFGVVGPRALSPDVQQKLRGAPQAGLAEAAFRQRLEAAGASPATGQEDLGMLMRDDAAKYATLVKVVNFRD